MAALPRAWWKYGRALLVPLLLWGLVVASLWEPIKVWLNSSRYHDRAALREWIENARGNLPDMVKEYVRLRDRPNRPADWKDDLLLVRQRQKIEEHLASLADPLTKMYSDQTPLFPKIYRIDILFDDPRDPPIVWGSHMGVDDSQVEEFEHPLGDQARVKLVYQLHAYDKRQRDEALRPRRVRYLSILAIVATGLAGLWVFYTQRRERERERQRTLAKVQVDQAERLLFQEERRRLQAERGQQQA